MGLVDDEINFIVKVIFVIFLFLALLIIIYDGFKGSWQIKYFRIILLLSSIIPISMRTTLDFAKVYYSY
jgi:phospholipid-translocating ATPase